MGCGYDVNLIVFCKSFAACEYLLFVLRSRLVGGWLCDRGGSIYSFSNVFGDVSLLQSLTCVTAPSCLWLLVTKPLCDSYGVGVLLENGVYAS